MKRCFSFAETGAADRAAIAAGTPALELMERAGRQLKERVTAVMKEKGISDVLFVCGGGNNGGDGFCAAQLLFEAGADVAVLCLAQKFSRDCAEMAKRYRGELFCRMPRRRFALLADCVIGTGLTRAPEGEAKALIEFLRASGGYILSCDLPSGLSENGIALSPCVKADETLSVGGLKRALLMADGADCAGRVSVLDIGLTLEGGSEVWEREDVSRYFPKRPSHSHKGNYGKACLVAGRAYSGASFLAAEACLKSGAGYTVLLASEPLYGQAVGKLPSCILRRLDEGKIVGDAVAFGMGEEGDEETYRLLLRLLEGDAPLILDAGALNALATFGKEPLKGRKNTVITPHIGEFARLTGRSKEEVLAGATELAESFSREYGVVTVLKNNRTVITDGVRTAINPTGSPALAKGGSGDALLGLLAGTCARGVPPFEAACCACFLLGRAGELAAEEMGEYSATPSDVIARLPNAILEL